jgi:hypothetical protein
MYKVQGIRLLYSFIGLIKLNNRHKAYGAWPRGNTDQSAKDSRKVGIFQNQEYSGFCF